MAETWADWFGKWCVAHGVFTCDHVAAVKHTDFYATARRMYAKGNHSDRVMTLQLDGALGEINGAARAPRKRT